MIIHTYGNKEKPILLLLPGLGVSFELFLPLIDLLREKYYILTAEVDGFILEKYTKFTSIYDQAGQHPKRVPARTSPASRPRKSAVPLVECGIRVVNWQKSSASEPLSLSKMKMVYSAIVPMSF